MTLSLRQPKRLDELLNFRLVRLLACSSAPVLRLLEGGHGIARREWGLVALLAARGPLSPSALAEQAQLDRPRTSRAITSLVAKGLVERMARPGDARHARVELTAQGHALYERVFPQVAEINAQLVSILDDAAVDALDAALARLTARAVQLNRELVCDVSANRRAGGSRRVRPDPEVC